ncbi:type IV pilin-like G/H family protein [[Limnothrix rosea] IAM M-220]|uniref:type IV pilin-like G/H family protein n=1 Tax=[Limnothrix rosea] IAM M-220 TaxID=454133 RepID=UPI00096161BB|nr:type IV pilin-like G/H family protein [[Limnothrix rosea] IAM M-220]OKH11179.1 hypothetical protein NIES208_17665 [[Limnothrix rosea] IAM M-220]
MFESQVNEAETIKPKQIKRPRPLAKKKKGVKTPDIIVGGLLGVFLLGGSWLWWSSRDPYICSGGNRESVTELIEPLTTKLADIDELASSTPRIALASVIAQGQALKRELETLEIPQCAEPVRQDLTGVIDSWVRAYTSFAASEPDFLVEARFAVFEGKTEEFAQTFENMQQGISNYSVTFDMDEEKLIIEESALGTMGSILRGQQAFYLENRAFAPNVEALELGLTSEGSNYSYETSNLSDIVVHTVTPKTDGLRTLSGATAVIQGNTTIITCASDELSDKPISPPTIDAGILVCGSGSSRVD